MIDLSGISRQLHLSVDQIRLAAELLEQGFAPTFISRYRSDETGSLSQNVLWRIKLIIDRQKRLEAARQRIAKQLPKDVALDDSAKRSIDEARTVVAIESAIKSYRARRTLDQNQERDNAAGLLLEKMLSYSGIPIEDVVSWVSSQQGIDTVAAEQAVDHVAKLVAALLQSDSALVAKLRHSIQRKANVRVEEVTKPVETDTATSAHSSPATAELAAVVTESAIEPAATSVGNSDSDTTVVEQIESAAETVEAPADEVEPEFHEAHSADDDDAGADDAGEASESTDTKSGGSRKQPGKLTPRQRRRRWLVAMLAPLRSINKPLNKLTAYQHLMLGRGVRSQLVTLPLAYDHRSIVEQARDAFTNQKHPLAGWFTDAVNQALDAGLRSRLESEALAEMEEDASESLLEHATDELRSQLMRRPVRGHTIALIDTVGPKTVSLVIVDPLGNVLVSDELACSAQPEVVNQNVVKLGELIHKHRATLVALSNGPARRFMVATLRELMVQSKDSGLRWTMADRSGAEAYAGGKIGLKELATHNRRERAAIWTARCLQDSLFELLKVDTSRLRLGSYQRELPQEPLKQLVLDTIQDCVCTRGLDAIHASEAELRYIPGVGNDQAKQIVKLASSGKLASRSQLKDAIANWAESDLRQAIGWLRVFGSENALDATLVHPDDYRLAERLIDNTELSMPAAAPPNWVKRVSATVAVAPAVSVVEQTAETTQDSSDASVADTNDDSAEVVTGEAVTNEAAETEISAAETASPEPQSESAVSTEAAEQELSFGESQPTPASPAAPAMLPEYPEQIATSQVVGPSVDGEKLANQWMVGRSKLKSIVAALADPFGDPRLDGPPVPLRTELPSMDGLQPDDCVWAIVVGVADFGAFVELAPNCSGLIHISRLSTSFIEDPHQCVQVGDLLMTWVINVDHKKNRVALTALSPSQRAAVAAAAEQRKAQQEHDRSGYRRGGPQGGSDRGPRRENATGGQGHGGRRPEGAAGRGGQGGGNRPAGGRSERGNRERSGGRGPGRGGAGGDRRNTSVVVTSKKPVAPISQAMKEGDEPLRSFSDLMQFYESKRTTGPETESVKTAAVNEQLASVPTSSEVATNSGHNPDSALPPPDSESVQ